MYDALLDSFTEDETTVVHHALRRAQPGVGPLLQTTFTPGEQRAIREIADWTLSGYDNERTVISKCVAALKGPVRYPVVLSTGERGIANALLQELDARAERRAEDGERAAREAAAMVQEFHRPLPTMPVEVPLDTLVKVIADAVRDGIAMGREIEAATRGSSTTPAATGYVIGWRRAGEGTANSVEWNVYGDLDAARKSTRMTVTPDSREGWSTEVYALVPVEDHR